jgi:hypothetical protein
VGERREKSCVGNEANTAIYANVQTQEKNSQAYRLTEIDPSQTYKNKLVKRNHIKKIKEIKQKYQNSPSKNVLGRKRLKFAGK